MRIDAPAADPIFRPLAFKSGLTVPNRVFRSSLSGRFDNEDGSLTQTRINWESRFAAGGAGCIISSYVPVLMEGRIIAGYATIHRDDLIPLWRRLGEAVHAFGCRFILQLSHSGRQMDVPGVHNAHRPSLSPTGRAEPLHGFPAQAMTRADIHRTVRAFARGARRAQEAGLDGVELHAANGYLFTQFLSSGINDRTDEYGGPLTNRARFLLEVIAAIRAACPGLHLQVKLSAVDRNNVVPWEGRGNTLADTIQVARWCENAGVDALHVSTGSLFPHPLNPPGELPLDVLAATYDVLISSGRHGLRNFLFFRYPLLRRAFRWLWYRMKRGRPFEGVSTEECRAIRAAVSIPVISTGGYQTASVIREGLSTGAFDAVAIARPLMANPDLPRQWAAGRDRPARPCTYCNRCLANATENPMGCYEEARFPSREAMIEEIMAVYRTRPDLVIPRADAHAEAP